MVIQSLYTVIYSLHYCLESNKCFIQCNKHSRTHSWCPCGRAPYTSPTAGRKGPSVEAPRCDIPARPPKTARTLANSLELGSQFHVCSAPATGISTWIQPVLIQCLGLEPFRDHLARCGAAPRPGGPQMDALRGSWAASGKSSAPSGASNLDGQHDWTTQVVPSAMVAPSQAAASPSMIWVEITNSLEALRLVLH